jgi:hypothetical protein
MVGVGRWQKKSELDWGNTKKRKNESKNRKSSDDSAATSAV